LDLASRRLPPALQRRRSPRPHQRRHPAFLGYFGQRRQPIERYHPLYSSGVAGETAPAIRRSRIRWSLRPRFQRGISFAPMGVSVIAFLALLLAVAALRIVELQISRRHQKQIVADGGSK